MSQVDHGGDLSMAPVPSALSMPRLVSNDERSVAQSSQDSWRDRYAQRLLIGDLIVLGAAIAMAQLVRFGLGSQKHVDGSWLSYPALGVLLALGWWVSLQVHRVRSRRIIGNGAEEYRRVVVATFRAFAVMAMIALAFQVDASRLYLATAFPLGLLGLLVERKVARVRLHRSFSHGNALEKVLVVGGERSATDLTRWFARHPSNGYEVSGVWVPDSELPLSAMLDGATRHVPVMSTHVDLSEALAHSRADAVVVTDTEHLGHETLRDLTWQLEGTGVDLLLSPNVLDVSSARLTLHDVSGMPLLHLSEPQYAGASRIGKTLFDIIGAVIITAAISPLLLATALAVKLTSSGPVFYRQERVGKDGHTFGMIKFRSMRVGADAELAQLLTAEGKTLAQLPKLTRDPRITRVGAFIRRYSIDELPQVFNVIKGDMSLVGPRPQRDFEVAEYDHVATRRLTVRPGMTGLWQVSGRSNLPYEEAIRLDVHYVENWSITADLVILWRTVRAVTASDGAF